MWEVVKKLRDNARQILEVVVLIIAGNLPHWIDFRVLFKSYLENNSFVMVGIGFVLRYLE